MLRLPSRFHPRLRLPLRPRSWLLCGTVLLSLGATAQTQGPSGPLEAVALPSTSGGLPDLGDGLSMQLGAERRLGDRIARELYRDPDYIDDPVVMEYVQGIWQSLLAAARLRGDMPAQLEEAFAWEILLGKDRSVNAFALPGGYFGLHLGLVAVVSSRDELASVMAHELTHVTQRHIARSMDQQSAQTPWLIGSIILGILAAGKSVPTANALIIGGQAGAAQTQLNFSRDMEREADRLGFGLMAQAGFAPQGFVGMFEKLQQSSRLNDSGGFPYLRSHPLTTERMADMQGRVFGLKGVESTRADMREPTRMTLEHAMVAARAQVLSNASAQGLQRWTQSTQAELAELLRSNPAGTWYGRTLAALKQRDFALASSSLQSLYAVTAADPAAKRWTQLLGAELALAQNQPVQAAAALEGVAKQGRAAVFLHAQTDTLHGRAPIAAQDLQTWLADHPRDAQAWQLLSEAYSQQNRNVAAARAWAEVDIAHMEYEAALNRLQAAQSLLRQSAAPDNVEASIVDARARQISARLKEQTLER